jgi:hypothetical protein
MELNELETAATPAQLGAVFALYYTYDVLPGP